MSQSFGWDPTPSSPLGLTARVAPSWSGSAHQMAGSGGQVNAEMGYGLPAGRFVGTASVGARRTQESP